MQRLAARLEIGPTQSDFGSGLLVDIVAALATMEAGQLLALTTSAPSVARDLELWSRLTGHAIVGATEEASGTRWVVRRGGVRQDEPATRPVGERLWLYTNFDCNLACDYCCVRSSPKAPRRDLGFERVARIAKESVALGVRSIFITGGEPFLLPDIDAQIRVCAEAAPVTVLTNGMLFQRARLEMLRKLPRERVTLQVSLDSPTPYLHELHRGAGSWARAAAGISLARAEGFRVRIAATVRTDAEEAAFQEYLDAESVPDDDRVVRRVALRGIAEDGVAVARPDLVPEVTITADGVYFHPVGADDADLLVTTEIFPLARAFDAVREAARQERATHDAIASVFRCA